MVTSHTEKINCNEFQFITAARHAQLHINTVISYHWEQQRLILALVRDDELTSSAPALLKA